MSLQQVRNVSFGRLKANATGSNGVGFTIVDSLGATLIPRTTSGVYQLTSGSGIYSAYISFPDNFRGQVLWDTGTAFSQTYYAAEQYNVEENDSRVATINNNVQYITGSIMTMTGTLNVIYADTQFVTGAVADIAVTLDAVYADTQYVTGALALVRSDVDFIRSIEGGRWRIVNDQMIFYKSDNATEVARFDLFDQFGAPSSDTVFERRRV